MSPSTEKALRYLSRFSRTRKQVHEYLRRKGFSKEEISETISYLLARNFLNDESYAEAYLLSRIRKLDGPLKIKNLLFQKGIDSEVSEDLLKSHYPVELQIENARKLLSQRRKKSRESTIRFIASRGFNRYVILHVLREAS